MALTAKHVGLTAGDLTKLLDSGMSCFSAFGIHSGKAVGTLRTE